MHILRVVLGTAVLYLSLFLLSCDSAPTQKALVISDSLTIHHEFLGATIYGPRLTMRRSIPRIAFLDDAYQYAEFDLHSGALTDRINFAHMLKDISWTDGCTVTGVVWRDENTALLSCVYPKKCIIQINLPDSSATVREYDWAGDSLTGMWAYSYPSVAEQVWIEPGTKLISAVQSTVEHTQSSRAAREVKYKRPPLLVYTFDSNGGIVNKRGIGAYPRFYIDQWIRIGAPSHCVAGDSIYLSFATDPNIYVYSMNDGSLLDRIVVPDAFPFTNVQYDTSKEDAKYDRQYYFESPKGMILRHTPNGVLYRAYVYGGKLPEDKVVPREHDKMDWSLLRYDEKLKAWSYVDLDGRRYLNTFFDVIDSRIILRANEEMQGITKLYFAQMTK